jgi:hypothetical protein
MKIKCITICRITPTKTTPFDNAVSDAAEQIADRAFHMAFHDLPANIQMQIWLDSEVEVRGEGERSGEVII